MKNPEYLHNTMTQQQSLQIHYKRSFLNTAGTAGITKVTDT